MPQSYFEPFLKDELQRLDKLCGNSVLHKGFSDFWTALPDAKKRSLLQVGCLTLPIKDGKMHLFEDMHATVLTMASFRRSLLTKSC
jgi:hypothetical protein